MVNSQILRNVKTLRQQAAHIMFVLNLPAEGSMADKRVSPSLLKITIPGEKVRIILLAFT